MTKAAEQVLAQALTLSDDERAELAARLLETLDPAIDADYVSAWETEIGKRFDELQSGKVKPVPWEQAREVIRRGGRDAEAR